jgi:hypothetical protein
LSRLEPIKIIGQIAEFKRSGSLLVNDVTLGIKSKKENIQLLGPHAQMIVSRSQSFISCQRDKRPKLV